ncbi:transcription factor 25 (basic helix-loop-helix) [Moniliophthora roreri MCA 2997]|uniref:Transcription factor 25 (Basic helix-loop-helix) n=2 Tax=Moniliophthora roreri TaxID=221103 RepID=V2WST6_MONRO|nr:transcription factor 25 (basic helix-loop-helix) [Moniliophthora roreri MCA 2997]KAI3612653.1 transcription factor 25 (basic helix-loop-helix) [Moniliophthora roreri]
MAPRLSKRQQRALDELEDLNQAGSSLTDSEEEEFTVAKSKSGFAALFTLDDENDDDGEETQVKSSKKKPKKKKKAGAISSGIGTSAKEISEATAPVIKSSTDDQPANQAAKNDKKAAKKAKAKAKKKGKDDNGLDEIDRALEELSIKHPEFQKPPTSEGPSSQAQDLLAKLSSHLSVSFSHLDSSAELRRFFGSKVVKSTHTSDSPGSHGRRTNAKQPATERSNLTRPQPGWPPARIREGLSLRPLNEEELARKGAFAVKGERWWTVEYGKKYKSVTKAFLRTVFSGDPQGFFDLLYRTPWHADTLLQLSEVYRHRDEHAQAIDLIDRSIFAYERAFLGMGSFNFTSGVNRLDFDRVENRVFFMAVHRVVADLTRRGLTRTAFEFARLLWALDPWADPHGALFHLEFLAPKGMGSWMEEVSQVFEQREADSQGRMNPTVLPGWTWSRAVVLRLSIDDSGKGNFEREELEKKSTEALIEAIKSFPTVLPLLADKVDVTVPDWVRSLKECRVEVDGSSLPLEQAILHLLSHLYVQRAWSLWKTPTISSWLSQTIKSVFGSSPSGKQPLPPTPRRIRFLELYSSTSPAANTLRHSVWRHVIGLETTYRSLFKFMPRSITETRSLSCDPLPPPGRLSEYDTTFFADVEDESTYNTGRRRTRAQREADERRLARLVPDADFRQQIQAIFDAHPMLAERFQGGVFEFAQRLAQMPQDMLDDLMANAAAQMEGNGDMGQDNIFVADVAGGMPGGFGDDNREVFQAPPLAANPPNNAALANVPPAEGEDETDRDEDEDEDEDEDIAPMPVRIIRNFIGRFWGGGYAQAEDADSSDGDEPQTQRDNQGVD